MFTNFRKETSERSDSTNWDKQSLINNTPFYFDIIECCNENNHNVVTHLMERARVDYDKVDNMNLSDICNAIINLETEDVLTRKINFAKTFNINLTYVLYNNEIQKVWVYEFTDLHTLKEVSVFNSFKSFSEWISTIKGWKSTKRFREISDLPLFDKVLRQAGTAWPTNIDCFISDKNNKPIAILEFQNAKNTSVKEHCNNDFFLCKLTTYDQWGHTKYQDDIRRWLSQEILRLQSGLRLFVITWAQGTEDFILKEVETITFPELPFDKDWNLHNCYKRDMHEFAVKKDLESAKKIAQNYQSYNLVYLPPNMDKVPHDPPLSAKNKTFPHIYYKYKQIITSNAEDLPVRFISLIKNDEPQ